MANPGRGAAVIALALAIGAAPSPGDYKRVEEAYAGQLGRQCPAKHLELLSPAELRDALDDYKAHLAVAGRRAMNRTEAQQCATVTMGASCSNMADIKVADDQRMLAALTASICGRFELCHEQSDCEPASADSLLLSIRHDGPARAAAMLSKVQWTTALDEAAAGRADWIDAVAALRSTSDSARSESIDKALSDALLTNPTEVLKLLGTLRDFPGADWFCQDRAIEPNRSDAARHTKTAIASVGQVQAPGLIGLRDRCLASLKAATRSASGRG